MGAPPKTVRRKLAELMLGMSLSLLVLTLSCVVAYEVHRYRQGTARTLSTIAEIVAENSAAVLMFDDEKLAQQILSGLRAEPELSAAALFDKNGRLYATYPHDLAPSAFTAAPPATATQLGLGQIVLSRPVMQGEIQVGTIAFKGDLSGTYERLGAFALVLVGIGIASAFISFGLSQYLERRISQPLAALTNSARKITIEKDYSLRAVQTSGDEFGELATAFNVMLEQIQATNGALHQQEERFRTLADNMLQLAWMADDKGNALWYNNRWYDYTGLDYEGSRARVWDIVHPEHQQRVRSELTESLEQGRQWEDTFPLLGQDGQFRWFLASAIPIRDAEGRVTKWFGTNTDVTDLREVQQKFKRARDEAVAASRAKDDFLARLSHELRTPLSPVLLIVSEQSANPSLPEEVRTDFETIKNNVELEARLIDDLLDLTAIVRGKVALQTNRVPIEEVVREAVSKIAPDAAARNVAIAVEGGSNNCLVECDAIRMQQAFWNILKNAVKFSPAGTTVSVTTQLEQRENHVCIIIKDSGIGMTPEELEKIFTAFAQGDHAAGGGSHQFGGLGLGLAIARSVIELHSGQIFASSAGRNTGSTFTVQLPVSAIAQAPVDPKTPAAARPDDRSELNRSAIAVLLVEDHGPTRNILQRLLVRRNFLVTCVDSASQARTIFPTASFDLLISDIGLPDGSGYDLMNEFSKDRAIVGIAMTGYGMESDVVRAREAGFLVHLIKPVKVELLDHALRTVTEAIQSNKGIGLN